MLKKFDLHYIDFKKLPDMPIIVDAGACFGKYVKMIKEKVPESKIIAIECDKDNLKVLRKELSSDVIICNKALVGNHQGKKLTYYKYIGLPYSGSVGYEKTYIKNYRKYKGMLKYEVETLGINDIFSEFGIDRVDYLKMNIEGIERDILAAMTKETASRIFQISLSIHTRIRDDLDFSSLKASAGIDLLERLRELGFNAEKVDRRLMYGVREA